MTSPNLDPIDLVKLTEVAEAATQGPWEARDSAVGVPGADWGVGYPASAGTIASLDDGEYIENPNAAADARFIATFDPPTVLRLIQRLREVEGARFDLTEVAKIIDPEAYDEIHADDNEEVAAIFEEAWEEALAKAAAIVSALSTVVPPVGEGKQGVMVSSDTVRGDGARSPSSPVVGAPLDGREP